MTTSNKPESQTDDCYAVCPYCLHNNHMEAEDYSEDERDEECAECGKDFRLYQSFSVTNHTAPICISNVRDHGPAAREETQDEN